MMATSMSNEELAAYIEQVINAGFNSDADESSLTNSFQIKVNQEQGWFDFIPSYPGPFVLDQDFNNHLQTLVSAALFPIYTLQSSPYRNFIATGLGLNLGRGLRFYFTRGTFTRLKLNSFDEIQADESGIKLGENIVIDWHRPSLALSGFSGSGKSIALNLICHGLEKIIQRRQNGQSDWLSDHSNWLNGKYLTLIDPKLDINLYQFAKSNKEVGYLTPSSEANISDYLNLINTKEAEFIKVLAWRQRAKIRNPMITFPPVCIAIDEVEFALSAANRNAIKTFQALTDRIVLTCRSGNGVILLSSENYPVDKSISSASRDGLSYRILLGNPTENNTRYLFPDFDPTTLVMEPDEYPFGSGIIMGPDNRVLPLKIPLVRNLR